MARRWRCWPTTTSFCTSACSCTRAEGFHYEKSTAPRPRDPRLDDQDRVELLIDIDRDFVTYYRLTIDHRGWTGEACWGDQSWDPELVCRQRRDRRSVDGRGRDSAGRVGRRAARGRPCVGSGHAARRARRRISGLDRAGVDRDPARGFRISDLPLRLFWNSVRVPLLTRQAVRRSRRHC